VIAYFDTSALIKLFVDEVHSEAVRRWAGDTSRIVISQLAWVETCAALAMKRRTSQLQPEEVEAALALVRQEWPRYHRVGVEAELVTTAGSLALAHDLRAYDSVQLASAQRVAAVTGAAFRFCCFDQRLNAAAAAIGLPLAAAG
jgi:predicted nucleic acid-binding protein